MEQRTCNIIMCCKNHGIGDTRKNAVIRYMSHECDCLEKEYTDPVLLSILRGALYDYIDGCKRPSVFIRDYHDAEKFYNDSEIEKILSAFSMSMVKQNGEYINGFTENQIAEAKMILSEKK